MPKAKLTVTDLIRSSTDLVLDPRSPGKDQVSADSPQTRTSLSETCPLRLERFNLWPKSYRYLDIFPRSLDYLLPTYPRKKRLVDGASETIKK